MIVALVIALRLALAVVLGASAVAKLRAPGRFVRDIARYRLLPDGLVGPVAILVIALEVFATALLFAGLPAGPWVALALSVVFAGAVGSALIRGLAIPCGCFGGDETVSGRALVRVGMLAGVATAAGLLGLVAPDRWVVGLDLLWVGSAAIGLLVAGRLILIVPDVLAAMGRESRPAVDVR